MKRWLVTGGVLVILSWLAAASVFAILPVLVRAPWETLDLTRRLDVPAPPFCRGLSTEACDKLLDPISQVHVNRGVYQFLLAYFGSPPWSCEDVSGLTRIFYERSESAKSLLTDPTLSADCDNGLPATRDWANFKFGERK